MTTAKAKLLYSGKEFELPIVEGSEGERGLVIADPISSGADIREYGYFIALTQEITRFGAVGFRFDYYDPNSDFLDKRAGRQLPTSQRIRTYSPFLAVQFPGHARLVFEWDIIDDYLARDKRGVPSDWLIPSRCGITSSTALRCGHTCARRSIARGRSTSTLA